MPTFTNKGGDKNNRGEVDKLLLESNERLQTHLREKMAVMEEKNQLTAELDRVRRQMESIQSERDRLVNELDRVRRQASLAESLDLTNLNTVHPRNPVSGILRLQQQQRQEQLVHHHQRAFPLRRPVSLYLFNTAVLQDDCMTPMKRLSWSQKNSFGGSAIITPKRSFAVLGTELRDKIARGYIKRE
ncbi:hypothetical protein ACTXT7_015812 [Hymenolepis weldensis]